ncbi:MAG TPA: M23 family metallopeptidase, partial [Candidatus Glassbacteria bacterium]|nr:M23 family metallopeptidase [Candidatus Glassbacteria bacterium]
PPLAWPTEHRIVTQAFGARPEYYAQFGLPGHEGVDLRAPEGSRIHAAASGVVTRVESGNKAYGVSVRHSWNYQGETYECVYAHGVPGSVRVKVGDAVTVGQVLMLADSTGNAQGSHLHFSLKRVGATAAGYRDTAGRKWPFDIVSPVKFLGI